MSIGGQLVCPRSKLAVGSGVCLISLPVANSQTTCTTTKSGTSELRSVPQSREECFVSILHRSAARTAVIGCEAACNKCFDHQCASSSALSPLYTCKPGKFSSPRHNITYIAEYGSDSAAHSVHLCLWYVAAAEILNLQVISTSGYLLKHCEPWHSTIHSINCQLIA